LFRGFYPRLNVKTLLFSKSTPRKTINSFSGHEAGFLGLRIPKKLSMGILLRTPNRISEKDTWQNFSFLALNTAGVSVDTNYVQKPPATGKFGLLRLLPLEFFIGTLLRNRFNGLKMVLSCSSGSIYFRNVFILGWNSFKKIFTRNSD
jgi:hypothetical protein